jgi:hypothetical protein
MADTFDRVSEPAEAGQKPDLEKAMRAAYEAHRILDKLLRTADAKKPGVVILQPRPEIPDLSAGTPEQQARAAADFLRRAGVCRAAALAAVDEACPAPPVGGAPA